jgi:hypothetical protein
VKSEFNADSIMIGNHVSYTIIVETAMDVHVDFPVYSDTITGEIEILSSSDTDTTFDEDRRIISREYKVTSFDPGWNTVPPQPVAFETGEFADTVFTTALLLTVLAPVIDTTLAIKPIKPPVNTPVSFAEVIPWALLGFGGALLILLGIYLYRRNVRKKVDPEFFSRKPVEPAHVIAFRELDLLKSEKLPQNGRVKEYYTRLTAIVRVYITRQFNIHAMESTSSEILEEFAHHYNADKKLDEMLENLLMLADLVKFAKEDPLMEENDRHLANAVNFVDNTYKMFLVEEEIIVSQESIEEEKIEVESLKLEENDG